jgi:hypothetical protein
MRHQEVIEGVLQANRGGEGRSERRQQHEVATHGTSRIEIIAGGRRRRSLEGCRRGFRAWTAPKQVTNTHC